MVEEGIPSKILAYLDRNLAETIRNLTDEEKKVLKYFLQNISVGSIISLRELKSLYRVQEPKNVIRSLIDKGLLEQGYGCYSLAKSLREALFKMLREGIEKTR
uniref:Uncharacterized protein n=1 Tax=Ignisphaera aggregans TaxID=334771 RepID=A0A7C2VBR1_9CREN